MSYIYQADDLRPHLQIGRLIDPVTQAFLDFTDGRASSPITILHPTNQSDMHIKSSTLKDAPIFTVKMAGWSKARTSRGTSPVTGMIAVFDSETCNLLALLNDDHLISDYRTAAAGAAVANSLARKDSEVIAVIGAGTQARLQAEAVCLTRNLVRIIVWARDASKAERLADDLRASTKTASVEFVADLPKVVSEADIVVCATAAKEPLICGEWLRPGQHITSVGSDDDTKAELASSCLDRADLIAVDSLEAAKVYGNLARATSDGDNTLFSKTEEIGALMLSDRFTRLSDSQITCASLVGLGAQDLAAVLAIGDQLWRHVPETNTDR